MAKKKVLFLKVTSHLTECGVAYDKKFLSLAVYFLKEFAEKDPDVKKHIDIEIMLTNASDNDEDTLMRVWEMQPDLLAFSSYLTEFEKTVGLCRKIGYIMPEKPMIIGGPCVLDPTRFLKENPFLDIIVEGEGEFTFRELMRRFAVGEDLRGLPGTTYREGRKSVKIPPDRRQVDLDAIPEVIDEKFVEGCSGIAIMETSRGCPNKCKFCGVGTVGMRTYPIQRAEKELKAILSNTDIKRVFLGDADFFNNKKRTLQILDIIKKYNKHKAKIELYADFLSVDEGLLAEARKAYVDDSLRIPIQSIHRQALLTSGRHWFNLEDLRKNIPVVLRHFPSTRVELIVGLPDDNYQGIKDSFRWCLSNGVKLVRAHRLNNLPNSEYSQNPGNYGLIGDPRPPHRVYQSRGFPYADIYKAEILSLNYQVFTSFVDMFDYHSLLRVGIDVIEVSEKLHTIPGWRENSYIPDEEANILEAKPEAIPMVVDYLATNFSLSKASTAFLYELFRFRHEIMSLYNYFKRDVLYNPDIHHKPLDGAIPFVPYFSIFESRFDLLAYEDSGFGIDNPIEKKKNLLLMYSYKLNRVVSMEVKSTKSVQALICQIGDFFPNDSEKILRCEGASEKFVASLKEQGFIFYTKVASLGKTMQIVSSLHA